MTWVPAPTHPIAGGFPIDPVWRRWLFELANAGQETVSLEEIARALGSPDGTVGNIPASNIEGSAQVRVNGSGAEGYSIGLNPVADAGTGELLAVTRDAFGRVAGSRTAWPDVMARLSFGI